METRRYRRRTSRARHVPDHIPGGGHVQDAEHDQHEHRTAARAERQEQNDPGGAQGGDRAHGPLPGRDRDRAGRRRRRRGRENTAHHDVRQTRPDCGARRPGLRQDVRPRRRLQRVREVVRQEAGAHRPVLRRHAPRLVQPGTAADHMRAADVRAPAQRAVRAAGRVVRPAVRQRLVPDAVETVRGRVPHVHAGAVHRRPAPAQPAGQRHRGRPVLVANRVAVQRAHRVHHAVRSRRVENDSVAKRPV